MKHQFSNFGHKSNDNFVPTGAVVVDDGVGGAVLLYKMRSLPLAVSYLNVCSCPSQQADVFVAEGLSQMDLTGKVVVLASPTCNAALIKRACPSVRVVACQPPIVQAMQYSTKQVAVLSSCGRRYDGCLSIDASSLANLLGSHFTQRQALAQIDQTLRAADGCDAVVLDDCIFSTQLSNFYAACPNVKFFDCADSLVSIFYKCKKLRKSSVSHTHEV
ncbi:MAG: hypothetical protein IKC47_01745, partial [Clostridia bacterium]|nr:hypothetical protein [Clostridia bacterium]